MAVYRVACQQRICLPQARSSQCRKKDNQHLSADGIGRMNAVIYNLRQVSGTCLCGRNIAAGTTRRAVTGQLGFHRKTKRQEAQAKGKHRASETPRCGNPCHRISLPCRLTDHSLFWDGRCRPDNHTEKQYNSVNNKRLWAHGKEHSPERRSRQYIVSQSMKSGCATTYTF